MWPTRNSPLKRIRVLRRPEVRSILSVNGQFAPSIDLRCNPSANGNELERRDLDPPLVPIFEEFLTDQENAVGSLKRDLLIFSRLIFESSVWDGIPSLTAAPAGPETRPWLCASAASIISFSWPTSAPPSATVGLVNRGAC